MTYAFVAEAPGGPGSKLAGGKVLDSRTRSGRKLADLLGVDEVSDRFLAINLVDKWPGRTSHGSAFPGGLAKAAARDLFATLPPDVDLLLVGQRVARAFSLRDDLRGYFRWVDYWLDSTNGLHRRVAVIPHPSGVNRWWNDPKNEAKARRFLRGLAEGQSV